MTCTAKQYQRLTQLLDSLDVFLESRPEFADGTITLGTGTPIEIDDFDTAMTIISKLSTIDQSRDPDDLADAVYEILEGTGLGYDDDEDDDW